MKKIFLLIIIFSACFESFSQEILIGLQYNPIIQQNTSNLKSTDENIFLKYNSVNLPFSDDFSSDYIYPDTARWIDNEVFINSDFPLFPIDYGAATFDAINAFGIIYPEGGSYPFIADHLTSRPIRLDSVFSPIKKAMTLSDSIYFSFNYQPQGRGLAPQTNDSLILEFGIYGDTVFAYIDSIYVQMSSYPDISPDDTIFPGDKLQSPCYDTTITVKDTLYYADSLRIPCDSVFERKTNWNYIWSSEGMELDTFYTKYNQYFKRVMIPLNTIDDSVKYFKNDFQIRFFNYASLGSGIIPSMQSNCDQWNIDNVYLDIDRSIGDTVLDKISFVERAPSFLEKYQVMPYRQYQGDPIEAIKDTIHMLISNLNNIEYFTNYDFNIKEKNGPFEFTYSGGECVLSPFYSLGYQSCTTCQKHACPHINFIFPISIAKENVEFEVEHRIQGDYPGGEMVGDTIYYTQKFANYFSYDDGTSEAGYGLIGNGAKLAYKFDIQKPDSLRSIMMFFNRTLSGANQKFFKLCVWDDNNGKPGNIIYSKPNVKPIFEEGLNRFHTYHLDSVIYISSTIYVGWTQMSDNFLNLGYDTYINSRSEIFYSIDGEWQNSTYKGSLMIRPVIGFSDFVGINDNENAKPKLEIFPNPNNTGILYINLPQVLNKEATIGNIELVFYNMYGQIVYRSEYKDEIDVSILPQGLYIVRVNGLLSGESITSKVIISN